MRRSETLLATSRETPEAGSETTALVHRAGLIRDFGSGLFGFLPAGERVRRKVIRRVEAAMTGLGAQRVSLPALQYSPIWTRSGRWANFEDEMFTLENRDGQDMCLAPSHEEGVVHLFEGLVRSYEDLPLVCYQVGSKYRDDHARMGLLRTKEFTMKDAYSLHATEESLAAQYGRMREAYTDLFERLGLEFVVVEADNSVMGGPSSEEFVAPVDTGTVTLVSCADDDCRFGVTDESPGDVDPHGNCPECGSDLSTGEGIEIGHIFELGTRYAESMGLRIDMDDGTRRDVLMASYGIGIERLIHTLIAQHADEDGCRWPADGEGTSIAPYTVSIIPLEYEDELGAVADVLYEECDQQETLLFDDPDQTIGERFAESDLLGIPYKVVIGNNFRETGELELETRDGETEYIRQGEVAELFSRG